jgi:hypothetical protein
LNRANAARVSSKHSIVSIEANGHDEDVGEAIRLNYLHIGTDRGDIVTPICIPAFVFITG